MAYLRLIDLQSKASLEFESHQVRIGRNPEFEVVVEGEGAEVVSGNHARVFEREGAWYIEDRGSRNGTYLDEVRLEPGREKQLKPGSVFRLGQRGPRYRVDALQKRVISDTVMEGSPAVRPSAATMPLAGVLTEADTAPGPKPEAPKPVSPRPADTLTISMFETRSGEHFKVEGGRIRIGRGKECELRPVGPDDTSVSRVHAEIVLTAAGRVVVRDAQSRNGTFVGGERLSGERALAKGDRLRLGPQGPELLIHELTLPGHVPAAERKREAAASAETPKPKTPASSAAGRAAAKMGAPRRSFGGKGATVFFSEMFHETSKKAARRVRIAVWSVVVLAAGGVAAGYWYKDRLEQRLDQRLARQQAAADSVRMAATAEYERLSRELEAARAGSAPAAVVESLRIALGEAEARTAALEEALARAQASLQEQLAAGDSIRQLAQAELTRLQSELESARAAGTSGALLDSLRQAVLAAEERASQIASQVRAVRGGGSNLAAVAQANQSAVGLVTAYIGDALFDGSGFAITRSGYFVTNRHVLQPSGRPRADSVYVTLADQRTMRRARVVQMAPPGGPDLALLQIAGYDGPHIPGVDWTGTSARQGEPAALIGFPAGYGNALDESGAVRTTMTAGIFAKVTSDVINFDGFSVGGSSGSPIFNADGEVVGVHRAGLSEAVGMGFSVPIPMLVPLLPPEVKRELGIQ